VLSFTTKYLATAGSAQVAVQNYPRLPVKSGLTTMVLTFKPSAKILPRTFWRFSSMLKIADVPKYTDFSFFYRVVYLAGVKTMFSINESTLDRADTADTEVQDAGQLYANLNMMNDFRISSLGVMR
jgi:hypothetical protein